VDAVNQPTRLTDAERIDRLRLIRSDNVGPRTFASLLNHFYSAKAALAHLPDLAKRGGSSRAFRICSEEDARAELATAKKLGVTLLAPEEAGYPPRLTTVDDAPPLLGVRGAIETLMRPMIAIVGSRNASAAGMKFAERIARELGEAGFVIASGLALGIDAAAHRAALAAGGLTIAVLACGIDRPYPAGNASLFEHIAESGLLISEWPPGAEPLRHRFLIRNRVIAAATRGTVVVEASARSGASQTMSRVLALNRIAMVVPGPVTSAMSVGCHELLRNHPQTRLVTGLPHVLEEVGRIGEYLAEPPSGRRHPRDSLDEESALVLEAVPRRGAAGPEQLAARAGLSLRTVLRRLSLLETLGLVVRRDGAVTLAPEPRQAPEAAS